MLSMVPEQVWDWYCCSNCYSVLTFFFLFLGPSLSVLSFLLWNLLWLVEEVLSLLWFFLIVRMEISWFLWEMFESRSEGLLNAGLWTTGTLLSFVLLVNSSSLSLWLSLSPLVSNLKLTLLSWRAQIFSTGTVSLWDTVMVLRLVAMQACQQIRRW
jgi:hypothetical protein